MKILVCAATHFELPDDLPSDDQIITLIHGAGSAQAAYHLGKAITIHRPKVCIQIGIAGAFDKNLSIGDAVLVEQDLFADLGADQADGSFIHLSELDFTDPAIPFESSTILHNWNNEIRQSLNQYLSVKSITVNTTSGFQPKIQKLINDYDPQIETMEGAAFMAICRAENIPGIQLRTISNYVESRNKANWNIPLAVINLKLKVTEIIEKLTQLSYYKNN